jgi:hypothetical protein
MIAAADSDDFRVANMTSVTVRRTIGDGDTAG